MKTEHMVFPFVFFFNLRIHVSENDFYCVHTIRFKEPTKVGSLKSDCVNAPLEYHMENKILRTIQQMIRLWLKEL